MLMKNDIFRRLIYQFVSKIFVLPIYKFIFKGHLVGRENIPQNDSFIMVSNHGSLLDPPLLGHALGRNISCLLYTSPSPRDGLLSRMPSSA